MEDHAAHKAGGPAGASDARAVPAPSRFAEAPDGSGSPALRVRVLGPLSVEDGVGRDVPVRRIASRRLLGILTLSPGQALDREHVAFTLWPDDDEPTALERLRQALYWLARDLPPHPDSGPWVRTEGRSSIAWRCGGWLDIEAFDSALGRAADDPDPARARAGLQTAIALYRGAVLEGWDESWLRAERHRVSQDLDAALERLAILSALCGDTHAAVEVALRRQARTPDAIADRLAARMLAADGQIEAAADAVRAWSARLGPDADRAVVMAVADASRWLEEQPRPASPSGRRLTFVGRARDVDLALRLVMEHPVVTIVGEAGIGKSQLATAVGNAAWAAADVGPKWLSLGNLLPGDDPWPVLAAALPPGSAAAPDAASFVEALCATAEAKLVVIDDADPRIADVAALAHELGRRTTLVRLIVTAREPLRVEGESVVRLGPLDAVAAGMLLAEATDGPLHDDERDDVVTVVERVPLAVLLAAGRLSDTSSRAFLTALRLDPTTLAGSPPSRLSRHRSLAAAHAWGWARLPEAGQELLARIAAHQLTQGPTSWADVAALADDVPTTATLLRELVDRSMVTVERSEPDGDDVWLRVPQTLASFAIGRRAAS